MLAPCVSGALFSTISTVLLLAVVAAAVHMPALPVIAPSIIAALAVTVVTAAASLRGAVTAKQTEAPKGGAFSLSQAIGFALTLSAVTIGIGLANSWFGNAAVGAGAALVGFFDVHAAAASVFALASSDRLPVSDVSLPMLLGVTTNTISKVIGAYVGGGSAYALRVGAGLTAVLLAAWVPYLSMFRA